jgi:hypothetical protein
LLDPVSTVLAGLKVFDVDIAFIWLFTELYQIWVFLAAQRPVQVG